MNNLSIQFKNLIHKLFAAKRNLALLFFLGFLVLVGFEVFVVKDAINQIIQSRQDQPPSHSVQKVRVNFTDYNAAVKRLKDSQTFTPNLQPDQNPFKSK